MKSFCSYYNQATCRSCDMITLDYNSQLREKEKRLIDSLHPLKLPELLPIFPSQETHFRNKAKFVVTGTSAQPIIGLAGENLLDEGRELLECSLHVQEINQALPAISEFITLAKIEPYQISQKKGELKGLILFYSEESRELYLRLILRSKEAMTRIQKHQNFLLEKLGSLKCLSINIQPIPHALLEGEEEIILTEQKYIHHKMGNLTLKFGPRAFIQTNQKVSKALYETAANWIKESSPEKFVELYCGQGAFSFFAAPFFKEGLGVEINPEAIIVANDTARSLGYDHLKFVASDAAKVDDLIVETGPDLLLVNPPRRGLAEALPLIRQANAKTFIYSSCNYETLTQDLKQLSDIYTISRIQIFDMFPHTSHFETLVQLTKVD